MFWETVKMCRSAATKEATVLCKSHPVGEVSITHYPLGTTDIVRKQYYATPQESLSVVAILRLK
jgi:hypothetical protein